MSKWPTYDAQLQNKNVTGKWRQNV